MYISVFLGGMLLVIVLFSFGNKNSPGNIFSFFSPTPTPTPDPDPVMDCSWGESQGVVVCSPLKLRTSVCQDSVCCPLSNGTWTPTSKIDCAKYQDQLKASRAIPPPALMMPMYNPYIYGY
jgi:hypothetical protein